jgi:protein TonB
MPATCATADAHHSSLLGLSDAHARRILTASLLSIAIHIFAAWYFLAGHDIWRPLAHPPQTLEISLLNTPAIHPGVARKAQPLPRKAVRQPSTMPASSPTAAPFPAASTPAAQAAPTYEDIAASASIPQENRAPPLQEMAHTAPFYQAAYLHNPPPVYPLSAKRRGMEGRVMLRAEVQPDGRCSRVELKNSSGWEVLDQAALSAVRAWRFEPARQGTQSIVAWVEIPITFKLDS